MEPPGDQTTRPPDDQPQEKLMTTRGRRGAIGGLVLALGLSLTAGCQTWLGGMTLPSPSYLDDNPDYIPKAQQFTVPRQLAAQQAAAKSLTQPGAIPP